MGPFSKIAKSENPSTLLCRRLGVQHVTTTSNHPQANGMVERAQHTACSRTPYVPRYWSRLSGTPGMGLVRLTCCSKGVISAVFDSASVWPAADPNRRAERCSRGCF